MGEYEEGSSPETIGLNSQSNIFLNKRPIHFTAKFKFLSIKFFSPLISLLKFSLVAPFVFLCRINKRKQ